MFISRRFRDKRDIYGDMYARIIFGHAQHACARAYCTAAFHDVAFGLFLASADFHKERLFIAGGAFSPPLHAHCAQDIYMRCCMARHSDDGLK